MRKQELLSSVRPGMKLTQVFFRSIYFWEISEPGFADEMINRLEKAGCSRARQYYTDYVRNYEKWYKEQCRPAADWLIKRQKDEEGRMAKKRNAKHKFNGFPQDW